MRWMAIIVGVALIAFGVLAFTGNLPTKSFSVTSSEQTEARTGVGSDDGGSVGVQTSDGNTQKSTFPLGPVLGVIAIGGGLFLVARSISSREAKTDPQHA